MGVSNLDKEAGSGQRSIDHATRHEVACTRSLRGRVYSAGGGGGGRVLGRCKRPTRGGGGGGGAQLPKFLISAFLKRLEIAFPNHFLHNDFHVFILLLKL